MELPRFTTRQSRLGVALAFVGSALAVIGAYALSLLQTTKIDCQWYCPARVGVQHFAYVSLWIIVLIIAGGVAPLLVLLRPRLWWAGAGCSIVVVGFFAEYFLYLSVAAPFPTQPPPGVVESYAWLLVAGSVITTLGMILIRPGPTTGLLAPGQPRPSS